MFFSSIVSYILTPLYVLPSFIIIALWSMLSKNSDFNLEGAGRRKEPVLGHVPKNDEKINNSGSKVSFLTLFLL